MNILVWSAVAAGVVFLVYISAFLAPARTVILVDTATSTARAEMRLFWGLGPTMYGRYLPQQAVGAPLHAFTDVSRVAQALMTPGIADVTYHALKRLFRLKPQVARFELRLNLGNSAQDLVVQTAAQAALAASPASIRDRVAIGKSEAPGAEVSAKFELNASPMTINSIYSELHDSRAGREFRRRLKRAPKSSKRAPREVRS